MPPGNTLKVELLTVTPEGKPLMLPLTDSLNPLTALTESVACCCTPGMSERLEGCKDKPNPGGPVCPPPPPLPPPQPVASSITISDAARNTTSICPHSV